jgi:hypothetical protein
MYANEFSTYVVNLASSTRSKLLSCDEIASDHA